MSDVLFKIFGGAILCVMLLVILKRESPDIALTARMTAGVIFAAACVGAMIPTVEYINELGEGVLADGEIGDAVTVLLKALGVAILTHICATVCRDSGEGSMAYYVELGGKLEIMLLSLPLLRRMLDMALGLLEMS